MTWWQWLVVGLVLVALEMAAAGGFYIIFFGIAAIAIAGLRFSTWPGRHGSSFCSSPLFLSRLWCSFASGYSGSGRFQGSRPILTRWLAIRPSL